MAKTYNTKTPSKKFNDDAKKNIKMGKKPKSGKPLEKIKTDRGTFRI